MPTVPLIRLLARKQLTFDFRKDLANINTDKVSLSNQDTAQLSATNTFAKSTFEDIQKVLDKQQEKIRGMIDKLKAKAEPYHDYRASINDFKDNLQTECKTARDELVNSAIGEREKLERYFNNLANQVVRDGGDRAPIDLMKTKTLDQFDASNTEFMDFVTHQVGKPGGTTAEQKGALQTRLEDVKAATTGERLEGAGKRTRLADIDMLRHQAVDPNDPKIQRVVDGTGENPLEAIPDVFKKYLETEEGKTSLGYKISVNDNAYTFTHNPLKDAAKLLADPIGYPEDCYQEASKFVKMVKGNDPTKPFKMKYDEELYKSQDLLKRIENGDNELDILFGLIRGTLYGKLPCDRLFIANAVYEDQGKIKAALDTTDMKKEMKQKIEEYDHKIDVEPDQSKKADLKRECDKELDRITERYANSPYTDKDNKTHDSIIKMPVELPKNTGYPPDGVSPHLKKDLHEKATERIYKERGMAFISAVEATKKEIRKELDAPRAEQPAVAFGARARL